MQEKVFHQGDVIIRQGDYGDSLFQIVKGAVQVVTARNQEETKLAELKAGDYFGEMAVLEAYPRSATVTALEDGTKVLEIPSKEINTYFYEQPDKIVELFRHIGNRLRALTADYQKASAEYEGLTGKEEKPQAESFWGRIGKALTGLLGRQENQISAETLRVLKEADYTKGYSQDTVQYSKGTVVFKEGEPGRCLYAIHWGKIGIYAAYGAPEQKLLTTLMPGQFFGEMGLIDNAPRSATAVALENETTLEIISQDDLATLFQKNPPKVDMILQNLSYRLRRLTTEYAELCEKIEEKQKA